MKRFFCLMLALIFLPGCFGSSEKDYQFPPVELSVGSFSVSPSYNYSEYETLLEHSCLSSWFVHYRDVESLGQFVAYQVEDFEHYPIELVHKVQNYTLIDPCGEKFSLNINHIFTHHNGQREDSRTEQYERHRAEMTRTKGFTIGLFTAYGDFIEKPLRDFELYSYDGIYYYYSTKYLEEIFWTNDRQIVTVRFNSRVKRFKGETSLISQLLYPETARKAANEIDRILLAPHTDAVQKERTVTVVVIALGVIAYITVKTAKKRRLSAKHNAG